MLDYLKQQFARYFSHEESIVFTILLGLVLLLLYALGNVLAPFIVAMIIVFLLNDVVRYISKYIPHILAVSLVFIVFMGLFLAAVIVLLPLLIEQLQEFVIQIPRMLSIVNSKIEQLSSNYPQYLSEANLLVLIDALNQKAIASASALLSKSFDSFNSWVTWLIVYTVILPTIVFFMLKDRNKIVSFTLLSLPKKRKFLAEVWKQMQRQLSNYIRGKTAEVFLIALLSYALFFAFSLRYSLLLAISVGLSVIIPYVGAAIVTIPVALVVFMQFGSNELFFWIMGLYFVLQIVDGYIIVPLLFSEAVNLHPLIIILAIMVFGGLWGIIGIFFAIPLATFIKVILQNWPIAETATPIAEPANDNA